MAQKKLRIALASLAAGAMACSSLAAFADVDSSGININNGWYDGRIAGADRFQTAVRASQALQVEGNRDTIVIANAYSWSDVLAATPIADELDTTVLYSNKDSLGARTVAELKRLKAEEGVTNVLIVGGTAAVSEKVVAELSGLGFKNTDAAYQVDRVGGTDRFDTALLLALEAVNSYEGNSQIRDARAAIAALDYKEAAYQDALKVWAAARKDTTEKLAVVVAKGAARDAAQAALNAALAGIVSSVPMPSEADMNAAADAVVDTRNAVNNIRIVENFVNGVVARYAADLGTDFQNDPWTDVVAHFGSESFSVTLAGNPNPTTYTGTLAELTNDVPQLNEAASFAGTATTVKEVQFDLANYQLNYALDNAQSANNALAELMEQAQASQEAADLNAAQQKKIADASKALADAQKALDDANAALVKAQQAEDDAQAKVVARAADRPTETQVDAAKKAYNDAVNAALVAAKRYPAFLATGLDFADALAAGPAAADEMGVVLLTNGETVPAATARYLAANPNEVAVGGPASRAVPTASVKYVGKDRYETATKLANAYFDDYDYIGLASGEVAADAVVAGAVMANVDATLVLTQASKLPKATDQFLSYDVDGASLVVFGGKAAISNDVVDAAERAVNKR
jgi:putative cell wall-binding protein